MAKPATLQSAFNAGELDERLWERFELKYFGTGCSHAENVEIVPQGGFRQRDGLRDVGAVDSDAARLFPFKASDGSIYDLVLRPAEGAAWGETAELDTFTLTGLTADMLPELTAAQSLDTMLLFHRDLESLRVKHLGPTEWEVDALPWEEIPNYDYGADIAGDAYTNAVSAVWEIEFVGLTSGTSVFSLTVAGQQTASIEYNSTMATLQPLVEAAILDLPNIGAGLTVTTGSGPRLNVTFGGADNVGDGWAISGNVINKADAAILAFKKTPGVAPGEPIISSDRGWPQCGAFYGQRLLAGGFRSLPNTWMMSAVGDPFNFDERLTGDDGPAVIPMDAAGGEAIEFIVANRNLNIFTSDAEYWLAERALSRNTPPNHVNSSTHGTKRGVPIAQNEGASIYCHANGAVLGEFRYTDVEGNFVSTPLSLLASHLVDDIVDMGARRSTVSVDGNQLMLLQGDGAARMVTLLRDQEITAFARFTSPDADFIATCVNGRNEVSLLVDRPDGRRLERIEEGLLLDEAVDIENDPASATLTGLSRFNGRETWVISEGDIFGPFTPTDGTITLPEAVSTATVGTWQPSVVKTLPPSREIGEGRVLKRKARIHSVRLSLIDTTSVAISANGGPLRDVPLRRYGETADVPELEAGFTGEVVVHGLRGFQHAPVVTVSQKRPGRMLVRSITIEAVL